MVNPLDLLPVCIYNPEFDTYMTKKRLEPLMYKGYGVFHFSYFLSNAFRFLLALKIFFISCVGMICILVLKGNSACNASMNSSYSYVGMKPSLLILWKFMLFKPSIIWWQVNRLSNLNSRKRKSVSAKKHVMKCAQIRSSRLN